MEPNDLLAKQREREAMAYEIKTKNYHNALLKQGAQDSPAVTHVIRTLIGDVDTQIGQWLYPENPTRGTRKRTIRGHLAHLEADTTELALLTLRVALRAVQRTQALGSAASTLGGYVEEHLAWGMADKSPEDRRYIRAVSKSLRKSTSEHHSRAVVRHVLRKRECALHWDDKMRIQVGTVLLDCMLEATSLVTKVRTGKLRRTRVKLRISDELQEALDKEHTKAILLRPFHLPMCVEPRPWTEVGDGGYEGIELTVLKKFADGQRERMGLGSAMAVYQALNKLQRTKCRVNADILFLMRRCWREGLTVGKLPSQENMPTPAQSWDPKSEPEEEVLTTWKQQAARVHEDNARLVSKRLAMHSKLAQAGYLVKDPHFHYVYTLDWRGRAYPCGGDLTPQADDAGRALLEFADGQPIGDHGFFWLAVQLANTFGYDKVSLEERVKWVLAHEARIKLCAIRPMAPSRWWCEADKPWSFLAACQEWTAARAVGPSYVTHLPCAQDGSANGLQHFAALMRDSKSARAVNLVDLEQPADIYQQVADRTTELLSDSETLPHPDDDECVKWGHWWYKHGIDRGLVKRAVMTVPYGVSMYGIRDQLVTEMVKRHGRDEWMPKCTFLAPVIYAAIGDVVSAATTAMDWLKEVAEAAIKADAAVEWTTPLGLPVVQDYRMTASSQVTVFVGGRRKQVRLVHDTPKRDARKTMSGLSPNLIHSMDAAHMMATVNLVGDIPLAMVHDSYATLACHVDPLNDALRAAFVELHEQPLLEKFHQEVSKRYEVPPVPETGDFDLKEVLDADYFFA